jgi:glycosyltransferase involved in cell wall biosynthesis
MHNLTKIKLFRIVLWITYPVSLIFLYPIAVFNKSQSRLFFFFDRYAIGGAQRVHLDILESVKEKSKKVYFTRFSPNDKLKKEFYSLPGSECRDIHIWCDYLIFRIFTVHYYAFVINISRGARVIGSNSTFFYDLLPFLNKDTLKIELLHNFTHDKKGMEFFGLVNHDYLDKRLVIDNVTKNNILQQYRSYGINIKYDERVCLIEFGVEIPVYIEKTLLPPLKILYAGRGSAQKRIWLLNRVVEFFIDTKNNVLFEFAGSMTNELSAKVRANSILHGEIGDRTRMNSLLRDSHAIILTSSFEGFPVIIKEAMSYGCVPIVTALEGNRIHLKHLENALLMNEPEDEDKVVTNAISNIQLLLSDQQLLSRLSGEAYNYAATNFRKDEFMIKYRELLS